MDTLLKRTEGVWMRRLSAEISGGHFAEKFDFFPWFSLLYSLRAAEIETPVRVDDAFHKWRGRSPPPPDAVFVRAKRDFWKIFSTVIELRRHFQSTQS